MQDDAKPRLSLGVTDINEMLAKLHREHDRLKASAHQDHVINFLVTAHHLYVDGIKKNGSEAQRERARSIPAPIEALLQVTADVANGAKHIHLDQGLGKKKARGFSADRPVGNWHQYFFAPFWYVLFELDDAGVVYEEAVVTFAPIVVACLDWMVSSSGVPFPADQTAALAAFQPVSA